jgi:NNP family nitrate/nitrite transporter-like MFS transporter
LTNCAQGKWKIREVTGSYLLALKDPRLGLVCSMIYSACFGIRSTVNSIAAAISWTTLTALLTAGLVAASFGLMNLLARTLGGLFGDNFGSLWGLSGPVILAVHHFSAKGSP